MHKCLNEPKQNIVCNTCMLIIYKQNLKEDKKVKQLEFQGHFRFPFLHFLLFHAISPHKLEVFYLLSNTV